MGIVMDIVVGNRDIGNHPALSDRERGTLLRAAGDAALAKMDKAEVKEIREFIWELSSRKMKARMFGAESAKEVLVAIGILLAGKEEER